MSRLRRTSIRTRQSVNRSLDSTGIRDSPSLVDGRSDSSWAPPPVVAQNLARLSDSPMVPVNRASPGCQVSNPSASHFKSFIGDFLNGASGKQGNMKVPSPANLSAAKFQYKMVQAAPDRSSPLGKRSHNDSVEVGENELLVVEDEEDGIPLPPPQLPEDARRTSIDADEYDLAKSPFRTQTNPIPSPSPRAPKVSRVSSSPEPPRIEAIHVIDSDEMPPPRMEDDLKDFRFDDTQLMPTAAGLAGSKKSFTQDIVKGFLNTQSDFFETQQMGKTVDQDCLFPLRKEPNRKSVGTMTDPVREEVQIRQPLTDRIIRQRESLRAMVNSLNRANTAIVRFMGQIEKVCGRTSKPSTSSSMMRNGH